MRNLIPAGGRWVIIRFRIYSERKSKKTREPEKVYVWSKKSLKTPQRSIEKMTIFLKKKAKKNIKKRSPVRARADR